MTEDTEDICGAETNDGSPCQHPAGSCPVPSHDDPTATNPQGEPSKFDDEAREAALGAAREGKSKAGCARAAGVDESTLRGWLDRHESFSRAFAQARAEGESRLLDGGLTGEVDPTMARFLLASSFGYVKTEKREHEGEVEVSPTVDFSDA